MKNKLTPLSRVIGAATVDTYQDYGRVKHLYSHWAARGLDKLIIQRAISLPVNRVLLPVDKTSMTVTLPIDFYEEVFVGFVDKNTRVPIASNLNLVNIGSIEIEEEHKSKCDKCGGTGIPCEEFYIEESKEDVVLFKGTAYEKIEQKVTIRKVMPDGKVWLTTKTPFENLKDIELPTVDFLTEKELITPLDLKPCGCVDKSDANISAIKKHCYDVYSCYCTDRSNVCRSNNGTYKIFEEVGLIQLDDNYKFDKLYLEYKTMMPRVDGEYYVPKIAFEALVNWIKFKAVENKPNILLSERNWYLSRYKEERRNLTIARARISISKIVETINRIPRFEIEISQ